MKKIYIQRSYTKKILDLTEVEKKKLVLLKIMIPLLCQSTKINCKVVTDG